MHHKQPALASVLVLAVCLWSALLHAQPPVPVGEERNLAEDIGRTTSGPDVAVDSQGRFIVVWEDVSLSADGYGSILGRRLGADGEPMGDLITVAEASSQPRQDHVKPQVSILPDDKFVVVWSLQRPNPLFPAGPSSVRAQLFTSAGEPQGADFQVNINTIYGDRTESAVTTLKNGDFVVAWRNTEQYDGPAYPTHEIRANRFSSDGSRQGSTIRVSGQDSTRNITVATASRPNGDFVVAWRSTSYYGYYSASSRVLARTFDSSGNSLGEVFQVNDDTNRANTPTSIAADDHGNFMVVWSRSGPLGDPPPSEARGRIIDPQGKVRGEPIVFSSNGSRPDVATDANGNFLVAWGDSSVAPASGVEVVSQRWSSDGQPLSEVEILNTSALGSQFEPSMASGSDGNTFVAWREQLDDGGFNLRGRRFLTPCRDDDDTLCLGAERFRLEVEWTDFAGQQGRGRVVPVTSDDSGLLWFFAEDNWEMLVKVLDGCDFNGHHWVFAAATTNVQYSLRVTDTENGQVRVYDNTLGTSAPALTDTMAFATCP